MSKDHPKPTDAELEILQVLWQKGPSSVRQVHEHLSGDRDTGYTTTLKFMQIMAEKAWCAAIPMLALTSTKLPLPKPMYNNNCSAALWTPHSADQL